MLYEVITVLSIAGDQLPVMPLFDVDGKSGTVVPVQYGPAGVKDGNILGLIVMVRDAVVAHCPAVGVNA